MICRSLLRGPSLAFCRSTQLCARLFIDELEYVRPQPRGDIERNPMEHQDGLSVAKRTAMVLFFLTFFFLPHLGYGEVGNSQTHRAEPVVPGQFIVVLNRGFDPAQVAADHAALPLHVYRVASRGFAARLSELQVNSLQSDPRVNNLIADRKVTTTGKPATGGGGVLEAVPTGIKRIDAEGVPGSDAIVAIIDTGIDLDHPDLNVSQDCWFSAYGPNRLDADDGNGHGTHVAGTVGAIANTSGVRGVAPGASLCPIRVLDNSGSGAWSAIIAGIDYVTSQRNQGINIRVANMSLGGCAVVSFMWCVAEPPPGNNNCGSVNGIIEDPLHQAICNSTRAGGRLQRCCRK